MQCVYVCGYCNVMQLSASLYVRIVCVYVCVCAFIDVFNSCVHPCMHVCLCVCVSVVYVCNVL